MAPNIGCTPGHRSAGADRAEKIIDFAVQSCRNLPHRFKMRFRVRKIGILVRPEAIRNLAHKLLDTVDAPSEKLAGFGIRLNDQVHCRPEGLENRYILRRGFRVDDTNEPQLVVSAYLGETDP